MSARVIEVNVSTVPFCGMPYGWNPYTSLSKTASATNSGDSKFTLSVDNACWCCRSISSGANAGRRTMSERICSPCSKPSFITRMLANVKSVPAPALIDPPM
ncbi:MAG: hypothetical protein QM736_01195 [Vicinamibacterales bacterium]